jgi:hypothetical protein
LLYYFSLLSMHCVYVKVLSGTSSAKWHVLNFHTDRYVSTAIVTIPETKPAATGASMVQFKHISVYTFAFSHFSTWSLASPWSNQCSGVSESVLCWCRLNCVPDNELSFYKEKGIWRQIFPLWSLVAVRFYTVFEQEMRVSE